MDLYIRGDCDKVAIGSKEYKLNYYFAWNCKDDVIFWCGQESYKVAAEDLLEKFRPPIKCGTATVSVKERYVRIDPGEELDPVPKYPVLDLTFTREIA